MVYSEKQPHGLHSEKIEVLEVLQELGSRGHQELAALGGFVQERTGTCASESSLCIGEHCKGHQEARRLW